MNHYGNRYFDIKKNLTDLETKPFPYPVSETCLCTFLLSIPSGINN